MSWDKNLYNNPERFGLSIVAAIEDEDANYTFDTIVVWRSNETGKLYWAHDSGCSCPIPFDEYSLDNITPLGNVKELKDFMDGEDDWIKRSLSNRNDFLNKVALAAPRPRR